MKSFQMKLAVISLWLLLAVCPLQSQPVQPDGTDGEIVAMRQKILERGLRGYEVALRTNRIETMVESAIFQVTKVCLTRPEQDYAKILGELKRLAFEAPSSGMRYRAYIAACVVSNPERFRRVIQTEQLRVFTEENRNEFFALLAAELQDKPFD